MLGLQVGGISSAHVYVTAFKVRAARRVLDAINAATVRRAADHIDSSIYRVREPVAIQDVDQGTLKAADVAGLAGGVES